ncbi:hypothetical protein [Stackebrandtia soli]|uniref:hypothetical protein n=1 Tax=Stackebrandtia soli TaxID=1892856 RepID=UPI0039ED5550
MTTQDEGADFPAPTAPSLASLGEQPHRRLSSPLPSLLAGIGFFMMIVTMFQPLASYGDQATALRVTDLSLITPILGLISLVVATAVLCDIPRFLRFGRATAPLFGLILSIAIFSEIMQWGARHPEMSVADMTGSTPYFLIGGILLFSMSVLAMRPAAK